MQYICSFNLTDLLESNVHIIYVHISWVGDAMKITTPTHKGDQEGANTQPRYLYANPLTPSICSVLSLAVFISSQSLTRSENENNESRFGKWLALSIKSQDRNAAISGMMLIKIGTHSFKRVSHLFLLAFLMVRVLSLFK